MICAPNTRVQLVKYHVHPRAGQHGRVLDSFGHQRRILWEADNVETWESIAELTPAREEGEPLFPNVNKL